MFRLVYKRTYPKECGSSSVGRASAFQAECRGSESRLPLFYFYWRHGQVVRQKPAKLLSPSSNLGAAFLLFNLVSQPVLKLFSLKTAAPSISPVITLSFAKRVSPVHNFAARHVHHNPTCCSLFKATLSKFHSRPTVLP